MIDDYIRMVTLTINDISLVLWQSPVGHTLNEIILYTPA